MESQNLFVRGDVGTAVTFSGGAAYCDTNEYPANWRGVNLADISAEDADGTPLLLSNPEVKARACTVDRSSLEPRFLLDTWSGRNYKNYVDMYYNRFSSPFFLFSGYVYNGVTPLNDNFTLSGYSVSSGNYEAWVLSVFPSGITGSGIGLYPINFSGITAASGGYSIKGYDIENDGSNDIVSVEVDRDPIFYLNTVYEGENYITGFNVQTRLPVTHIHSSGIVVNTSDPADVGGTNVGNIFSSRNDSGSTGKVVLFDNHTIDSTIPTFSGEYDFGTGFRSPEYTSTDYVSLTATPSGTFMDGIVETNVINSLVDKIGSHETIRYSTTGTGRIIINNYTFDDSGWSFVDTNTIILPEYENGHPFDPDITPPAGNHIYTASGNVYNYLARGNYKPNPYYLQVAMGYCSK